MYFYTAFIICNTLFSCEIYNDHKVYKNADQCINASKNFYMEHIKPIGPFSDIPNNDVSDDQYINGGCIESDEPLSYKDVKVHIRLFFGPDKKLEI